MRHARTAGTGCVSAHTCGVPWCAARVATGAEALIARAGTPPALHLHSRSLSRSCRLNRRGCDSGILPMRCSGEERSPPLPSARVLLGNTIGSRPSPMQEPRPARGRDAPRRLHARQQALALRWDARPANGNRQAGRHVGGLWATVTWQNDNTISARCIRVTSERIGSLFALSGFRSERRSLVIWLAHPHRAPETMQTCASRVHAADRKSVV